MDGFKAKTTSKILVLMIGLAVMLITANQVIAQNPPTFPHQFYGIITINNQPAQDGLLVTVRLGNQDIGATTTNNGGYGYDPVFIVQGLQEGDIVHFYIQGVDTNTSYEITGDTAVSRLDLSLNGNLFCGDNVCGSGETCSNCQRDCGSCSSQGGGPGHRHGGTSRGGYSYPAQNQSNQSTTQNNNTTTEECVPNWICSDWLSCIGGTQKRVCVDNNNCNSEQEKPITERTCNITEQEQVLEQARQQESNQQKKGFNIFNMITGAVVGGGTISFIGVGIGIIIIIGIVLFFVIKKR